MPLPPALLASLQRFKPTLDTISRTAIAQQVDLWLVGGFLRDALLERPQVDLDLITSVSPETRGRAIARELGGHFVVLDADFGVTRIVLPDGVLLDFTRRQTEKLEDDLKRRDLTINAIALPLVINSRAIDSPALIDPTGGLADLEHQLVRAISLENLRSDPVRLIRIFRFAAVLDFQIDFETLVWVDIYKQRLQEAASERTTAELFKILSLPHAEVWISRLFGMRVLGVLVPELKKLNPTPPRPDAAGIALALEILRQVEALIQILAPELGEIFRSSLEGDATQAIVLKLGALLLEIGNPPSGEQEAGLAAIQVIARRLKLSTKARDFLNRLIKLQDEADALLAEPTDPVALHRFFQLAKDATMAVLLLNLAQHRAIGALSEVGLEELEKRLELILLAYFRPDRAFTDPKRLLDGQALMQALQLPPGKQVGKLLQSVLEAQLRGEISTQDEAIDLARSLFKTAPHLSS